MDRGIIRRTFLDYALATSPELILACIWHSCFLTGSLVLCVTRKLKVSGMLYLVSVITGCVDKHFVSLVPVETQM